LTGINQPLDYEVLPNAEKSAAANRRKTAKRICFSIPGKEYPYEKKPFSGLPGILSHYHGLLRSKMEA